MPVFSSDTPDGTNEGIGCKEIRFKIQAWLENAHFSRSFFIPKSKIFLPPGADASSLPLSGSSYFTATVDGAGIRITSRRINGFPTHTQPHFLL